jgi:hypothetical protein
MKYNSPLDIPNGWIQLTRPDSSENLQFAIDQLEKRDKKYSTCRHADGRVSVWVRRK